MASNPEPDNDNLSTLLQLEALARNAESEKGLQFFIVNESRRLINYRQAFLFSSIRSDKCHCRVETASSLSVIDKNSPFIRWLEYIVETLFDPEQIIKVQRIDSESCLEKDRKDWNEYSLPFVVWVPLLLSDGTFIGGIWLARETPWQDNEITLIQRLADTYAHAWAALVGKNRITRGYSLKRYIMLSVLAGLVLYQGLFCYFISLIELER